jgi:hypothetical protein
VSAGPTQACRGVSRAPAPRFGNNHPGVTVTSKPIEFAVMATALRRILVRLVTLWVAQVCRILADNCLRLFIVLEVARGSEAQRDAAWHLTTALLALPAVFLSPLNGALSNSLPKRAVLVGTTGFSVGVVLLFGLLGGHWPVCWGLIALNWVVYIPAR